MEMSETDKVFIARLEAMSIEQARREIALGAFGRPGEPNHKFASSWLVVREAEERDKRDASTLSISRKALRNSNWANIIAISAIIIAIIAIIVPFLTKK